MGATEIYSLFFLSNVDNDLIDLKKDNKQISELRCLSAGHISAYHGSKVQSFNHLASGPKSEIWKRDFKTEKLGSNFDVGVSNNLSLVYLFFGFVVGNT